MMRPGRVQSITVSMFCVWAAIKGLHRLLTFRVARLAPRSGRTQAWGCYESLSWTETKYQDRQKAPPANSWDPHGPGTGPGAGRAHLMSKLDHRRTQMQRKDYISLEVRLHEATRSRSPQDRSASVSELGYKAWCHHLLSVYLLVSDSCPKGRVPTKVSACMNCTYT